MSVSYYTIVDARPNRRSVDGRLIIWLATCVLLGAAMVAFQGIVEWGMLGFALLALFRWTPFRNVQSWQQLMLVSLTGFIILNYGFENFVLARIAGIPVLVGELLAFSGLALALWNNPRRIALALFADPAMQCIVVLCALTCLHLISDVPRFGLFALRDASIFLEAVFLLTGFLWTREHGSSAMLSKWLLFVFVVNFVYSCTLPIAETLQRLSPASGIFQPISLLGQYQDNSLYLVSGALFCLWMAQRVSGWKRLLLVLFSSGQLCALVLLQTRSMYVGMVLVCIVLLVMRERRKVTRIAISVAGGVGAVALLLLVISLGNINVHGRVVDLTAKSVQEHALTILALSDQNNRMGQDEDRLDWLNQVWTSTTSDIPTLLLGQGFGRPLIDFEQDGVAVRQPHNSTVGTFGRLGIVGVSTWILFHLMIIARFVRFITATRGATANERSDFVIWLFTFYILALVVSMVQPAIEFSHFAVPLYFFTGVALGIMPHRKVSSIVAPEQETKGHLNAELHAAFFL